MLPTLLVCPGSAGNLDPPLAFILGNICFPFEFLALILASGISDLDKVLIPFSVDMPHSLTMVLPF